jgi:hypothetical protein
MTAIFDNETDSREKHLRVFLNADEDTLSTLLEKVEELNGLEGFTAEGYTESPFSGFHPKAVRMAVKNDEYCLSVRAEHFVLIYGWSEALDWYNCCAVCLASHKGALTVQVFTFIEPPDAGHLI